MECLCIELVCDILSLHGLRLLERTSAPLNVYLLWLFCKDNPPTLGTLVVLAAGITVSATPLDSSEG